MRKVIGLIAWAIDVMLIGATIKHPSPFMIFLSVMIFLFGLFLILPKGSGGSGGDSDSGFDWGGSDGGDSGGGDGGGGGD